MNGKKEILARMIYGARLWTFFEPVFSGRLIVLNYHRLITESSLEKARFDWGVFGPTIDNFRKQMIWLKENTNILSEDDLLNRVDNPSKCKDGFNVVITFDDGYKENYTVVSPILRELHIPAIFFIPTLLIDARQLGWWDVIAYLVRNTAKADIVYQGEKIVIQNSHERAITFFHNKMEKEPAKNTKYLLEQLARACDVAPPDAREQDEQLLTWSEIVEMAGNNISIGSHTHTHRVLSTLDKDSQEQEMAYSKQILETRTGKPIKSIAFPVGGYRHFTEDSKKLARQAGYRIAFSFNTGNNRWSDLDPFDIKRVDAPDDLPMLIATAMAPSIFTWHPKQ